MRKAEGVVNGGVGDCFHRGRERNFASDFLMRAFAFERKIQDNRSVPIYIKESLLQVVP